MMLYLKLFESFGGGEYEEVDYNTWASFGSVSNLKKHQIIRIVEFMKTKGFTDYRTIIGQNREGVVGNETIIFTNDTIPGTHKLCPPKFRNEQKNCVHRYEITITAVEDEWFKVWIGVFNVSRFRFISINTIKKYYLCDEFDGLIKLLKEVL